MIIGVTGAAGSGKDAVANRLVFDHGFAKLHLADPMKDICMSVWGFTEDQMRGSSERRAEKSLSFPDGPTGREALQRLGTEWGRALHPDVWVRCLLAKAKEFSKVAIDVVVPDVRFDNEAKAIRDYGGKILLVERPGISSPKGGVEDHTSEAGLSPSQIDFAIENDGSLESLGVTVDFYVQSL